MFKKTTLLTIFLLLVISANAGAYSIKNNTKNTANIQEATIKGTVEAAVTCIPDPLKDATVTARNLNPLNPQTYTTKTNESGVFEIKIPPGNYKISAYIKDYRTISPKIPYIEKLESGLTYEYEFYMIPSKSKSKINQINIVINYFNILIFKAKYYNKIRC